MSLASGVGVASHTRAALRWRFGRTEASAMCAKTLMACASHDRGGDARVIGRGAWTDGALAGRQAVERIARCPSEGLLP